MHYALITHISVYQVLSLMNAPKLYPGWNTETNFILQKKITGRSTSLCILYSKL